MRFEYWNVLTLFATLISDKSSRDRSAFLQQFQFLKKSNTFEQIWKRGWLINFFITRSDQKLPEHQKINSFPNSLMCLISIHLVGGVYRVCNVNWDINLEPWMRKAIKIAFPIRGFKLRSHSNKSMANFWSTRTNKLQPDMTVWTTVLSKSKGRVLVVRQALLIRVSNRLQIKIATA